VLNQIIKEYINDRIAITSIGLDGEKIDNITFKPKPRIMVYKETIIATANDCLKECYFDFNILKKTNIRTPLGEIVIIEALSDGLALIAGPSTINEMKEIVEYFKTKNVSKIFIDGALFRKSIASFNLADSAILSTGASYNEDIKKVVEDTTLLLEELLINRVDDSVFDLICDEENSVIVDNKLQKTIIPFKSMLDNENEIMSYLNKNTKYLYINGALSNKLVKMLINNRFEIDELEIIVSDATHIVVDAIYLEKLKLANIKLSVKNKIEVLFLTYNPYSPTGYEFDNEEFKDLLTSKISIPIVNVLKD